MHIVFTPTPGNLVINARLRGDGLSLNGELTPWEDVPSAFIEYGEEGGVNVTNLSTATYEIIPSTFVRPTPEPVGPSPEELADIEASDLANLRAGMTCYRWQMILALGQARWAQVLEFGASSSAPWAMQMIIENAQLIPRLSETVDMLAWVLGMTEAEVDDLFRVGMGISA